MSQRKETISNIWEAGIREIKLKIKTVSDDFILINESIQVYVQSLAYCKVCVGKCPTYNNNIDRFNCRWDTVKSAPD